MNMTMNGLHAVETETALRSNGYRYVEDHVFEREDDGKHVVVTIDPESGIAEITSFCNDKIVEVKKVALD